MLSRVVFCVADVDECNESIDNCDINAMCTDSNGSYMCTCSNGYTGSGLVCMGEQIESWINKCGENKKTPLNLP